MAFPIAAAGEIWNISKKMMLIQGLFFAGASVLFLELLMNLNFLHPSPKSRRNWPDFIKRVVATYFVTLLFSACSSSPLVAWKSWLIVDPLVPGNRTILVALPACFASTVVNGLK